MIVLALLSAASLTAAPVTSVSSSSGELSVGTEARVQAYMSREAANRGATFVAAPAKLSAATESSSAPIPSFTRQTGLACTACHTTFPQLNAFGRFFKLNGYTLATQRAVQQKDSAKRSSLRLDVIPPVSAMVISSLSSVSKDVPGEQNGSAAFPQELGLFVGEAITPKLGTFLQLTYEPGGGIGIDNADIRFADQAKVGDVNVTYGLTLNNSPTVQDLWNSTPVWSFPFTSSDAAPSPMAGTLVDGALGQQVMGLGAYAMWNSWLYTEVSGYRSAFQDGPFPVDQSAENAIQGVTPYWRVAIQHGFGGGDFMIGTYGLRANLVPSGFSSSPDRYTDIAFDTQYDKLLESGGSLVAHGTWIHEKRHLPATVAAGGASSVDESLNTGRIDATYYTDSRIGFSAGLFTTTGDTDPLLYPADPVEGSATGSPDSQGYVAQISYMPWLNTRVGLQYMGYTKFNGASTNYDGQGRNASDNNAVYLMTWLAF